MEVSNENQIRQIQNIVENLNLDIWSQAIPGRNGIILVAKHLKETFEKILKINDVEYNIISSNIK